MYLGHDDDLVKAQRKPWRTNFYIWSGVFRKVQAKQDGEYWWHAVPTVVIDMDLRSWALPFAVHAGGPLISRPGFHFRIGPVNIGWSYIPPAWKRITYVP